MTSPQTNLDEFRWRAQDWLRRNYGSHAPTPQAREGSTTHEVAAARALQSEMLRAGFAGLTFPSEYGGQGLSVEFEQVFRDESAGYDLPNKNAIGVSIEIIGRTLLEFGTEAQKRTHLPKILSAEEIFVQMLSEPGAGSDLAGLLLRADRHGDDFVLNGQKLWTSNAQFAEFALCPARTDWDVPKRRGITVFIVEMRQPGIEIRPVKQIDGSAEFCEEFLTDVVVPKTDVVGTIDDGWRVIRGWLEFEHRWAGGGNTNRRMPGSVDPLLRLAKSRGIEDDPRVARLISGFHAQIGAHEQLLRRLAAGTERGRSSPALGGLAKMSSDRLTQRRAELGLELAGSSAVAWRTDDDDGANWVKAFLDSRSATLGGGSDEIQHNNVGERVLDLPREPSVVEDLPFSLVPHN